MSQFVGKRAVTLVLVIAGFALAPQSAAAQVMDVSDYTDGGVIGSDVVFFTDFIDNSTGCVHDTYFASMTIWSPSSRSAYDSAPGSSASSSLSISGDYGVYYGYPGWSMNCSCFGGPFGGGGDPQPVPVVAPDAVRVDADSFKSNPSPYYYHRVREYQVMGQGQPLSRVFFIDETMTTTQNSCGNLTYNESDDDTNSSGRFGDNFYFGGNGICDGGGSCTIVRSQNLKADGVSVRDSTLTYSCTDVDISPDDLNVN